MDRDVRFAPINALIAVAFVALIATISVLSVKPPSVPANAPLDQFSAHRAMNHIKIIAEKAHPMRSPEAAKVRDYLLAELKKLGAEPEIFTHSSVPGESIIGRIAGTGDGKAVMLSAHYDSVPEGPGAGDDAAGLAAILEAVRALRTGKPLRNDVIILFTDGEEVAGFVGARAFAMTLELRDHVGLVMNFEARGSRGPSFMFETSENNGWMIREFARASPYPFATSLAGAVYRLMPNNTDFTVFKSTGVKGLNFAFVEGVENYHQPTDTAENLDLRSVQHHGQYALALARHFGNLDLTLAASEPDAIYFNTIGPRMVVYPGSWVLPLMALAVAAFGLVVVVGRRRGRVTDRGLALGATFGLLALILATGASLGAWSLIQPSRSPIGRKGYQGSLEIAALLAVLGMIVVVCVYLPIWKRLRMADLVLGGLFWWLVGTVATALLLPGASYLFLWPLLFGLFGVGISVAAPRSQSLAVQAASYVGVIPALVLVPPTIQVFCITLGPSQPIAATPLAALLVLAILPMLAKVVAAMGRKTPVL